MGLTEVKSVISYTFNLITYFIISIKLFTKEFGSINIFTGPHETFPEYDMVTKCLKWNIVLMKRPKFFTITNRYPGYRGL